MNFLGVFLPTVPPQDDQLPFISWKGAKITGPPYDFAAVANFRKSASDFLAFMSSRDFPVGSQNTMSVFPSSRTVGPNWDGKGSLSAINTATKSIFLPTAASKFVLSDGVSPAYAPHCTKADCFRVLASARAAVMRVAEAGVVRALFHVCRRNGTAAAMPSPAKPITAYLIEACIDSMTVQKTEHYNLLLGIRSSKYRNQCLVRFPLLC